MKKRIGIIGFGWIAKDVHLPQYLQLTDACEITAVCDIDPAALGRAKEKTGLGDDRLFTDYKALIDSGLCDAVDICTPNHLHCEIAKYALNSGLPVSMEKPAGLCVEEVKEVAELSEQKGLPVFVCFSWRHRPTLRFLKDLVDGGSIGKLHHLYIKCIKDSALWPGRRLEWRFQKEKSGTGVLCDLGSHMLDLLNWFGADASGLTANRGIFVKERQLVDSEEWGEVTTDDWANLIFDLKDGANASVILSRGCATCPGLTEVEIYGDKGYLKFSEADKGHIKICNYDGTDEERPVPVSYGDPEDIKQSLSFINLLCGIRDEYTSTISDGLSAQILLDAAALATDEHRYVNISEIAEKF